jgi:hypothetical protein
MNFINAAYEIVSLFYKLPNLLKIFRKKKQTEICREDAGI